MPVFQRSEVAPLNRLHSRWRPAGFFVGGARFLIEPAGRSLGDIAGPCALIVLSAGNEVASVSVPAALLDEIIAKAGGSSLAQTSAQSALLLLEHLFSDQLNQLDYQLNQKTSLTGIHYPAHLRSGTKLYFQCTAPGGSYRIEASLHGAAADYIAKALGSGDICPWHWPEIPIEVALRVGMARVQSRLLESIRPGDAVIADAIAGKDKVAIVAGERLGAAGFVQKEGARLAAPFTRLSGSDEETWSMSESTPQLPDAAHGHDAMLDDIVVKLMFEMGRKEIGLGELRAITAGHIFDLSRSPDSSIDIYAGSRRIGQGEVVQIGEALGVRVTRLFNNE